MCARTGLWEPRVGNCPGPPGWPFDENGTLIGEDSYSGQAGFVGIADRKVPNEELPPEIRK